MLPTQQLPVEENSLPSSESLMFLASQSPHDPFHGGLKLLGMKGSSGLQIGAFHHVESIHVEELLQENHASSPVLLLNLRFSQI